MQILSTPHYHWIKDRINISSRSFIFASPFLSKSFVDLLKPNTKSYYLRALINAQIANFCNGSLDLNAVMALCALTPYVESLSNLHAKVYVVDTTSALITSGNATTGGMINNQECGVILEDASAVTEISNLVKEGFGNSTTKVLVEDLEKMRPLIDSLSAVEENKLSGFYSNSNITPLYQRKLKINSSDDDAILHSFSGWTQLVLKAILSYNKPLFTATEIYPLVIQLAAKQYPDNQHVEAKARQQLQKLRDFGIVEFTDNNGNYSLLIDRAHK